MVRDKIYVRPVRPTDVPQFQKFAASTENNQFDPRVPAELGTATLCAYNKSKTVMYLPVQRPMMMESICANPEATDLEKSQAIAELFREVVMQAHLQKASEIYFLGTEESIQKMAVRYKFEKLPWAAYRIKLKDLEPDDQN